MQVITGQPQQVPQQPNLPPLSSTLPSPSLPGSLPGTGGVSVPVKPSPTDLNLGNVMDILVSTALYLICSVYYVMYIYSCCVMYYIVLIAYNILYAYFMRMFSLLYMYTCYTLYKSVHTLHTHILPKYIPLVSYKRK